MDERSPNVVVIGAGGHALVSIEVLHALGYQVVGCVSADGRAGAQLPVPMIGCVDDLARLVQDHNAVAFIAIGDNRARQRIHHQLVQAGIDIATAVSPRAIVSPSAQIGDGALIMPGAVINAQAQIGAAVIVNTGAVVDHECRIDDFAHLCPNSALAGRVTVGSGAFIGIGSAVIPMVTIGPWATIGAGSAVIGDVAEGVTVVGTPARPLLQ
ncbi:MAG TPA: acetyltransferase [Ilumatobacteraceae bacterium]|nr:acetyltransferase [Ilumatobacteraceae bacterium]